MFSSMITSCKINLHIRIIDQQHENAEDQPLNYYSITEFITESFYCGIRVGHLGGVEQRRAARVRGAHGGDTW